jgi:hypothetical protein
VSWDVESEEYEDLGYFRIFITPPNGVRTEVTFFRDAPTQLASYTFADPFGDSTAQLVFNQIGIQDDLGNGDLTWFREFADVDIVLERTDGRRERVWEGYFASMDWAHAQDSSVLTVTCQGALFQADRYVARPQYPGVPISHEKLIAEVFSARRHPHMRTQELTIEWPDNWAVLGYKTVGSSFGTKETGFKTRVTGAWDKALTGFVANLLSVMYTTDYADQWTIRKDPGRKPVMHVRMASRPPDYIIDAGQPGVTISLSRDFTQFANVIYGSGTTVEGSEWSRQELSRDNALTDYVPMAIDPRASEYPPDVSIDSTNTVSDRYDIMRAETHVRFEDGMEVTDAMRTSQLMLRRNQDPGYAGSITLNVDPQGSSRYLMKAGHVIKLAHFAGLGDEGINLHITECQVNVADGTVVLTVDSKFRDALTVEETLARTRDPLTPIRMLQIGKQSILIPDKMAPWSYSAGAGFVPKAARPFFDYRGTGDYEFPYEAQAVAYPPKKDGAFYVGINAAAKTRKARWTGAVPIRMAEKGDIRLTQFACFDRNGNRLKIPFHVSLYYTHVTADDMPYDGQGPSPFIKGAFQTTNEFGQPIPAGTPGATLLPQESLIIGWGDHDQPAGYSPGTKTNGDPATGLLIDETTWSFDCTNNPDFDKNPKAGYTQPETAITVYAMFYAEYHEWVYVHGRLFRKEPGT